MVRVTEESDRAIRYRQRAEEMRTIAAGCREPKTAAQLIQVADDWEKLARAADTIEATNQALQRDRDP